MTTPNAFKTREEWLNAVTERMAPWFDELGYPLPRVRCSIGFTSKGMRGKRIGECWSHECSEDQTHEIFIVPTISDPSRISDILAHELVHAAVGLEAKHGKLFKKVATAIGLTGKMTATVAGPDFLLAVEPILQAVGPFPHATLTGGSLSSAKPKQKTRQLKCECRECGYIARTTAKWLELAGPPICPQDRTVMDAPEVDTDDESEDGGED